MKRVFGFAAMMVFVVAVISAWGAVPGLISYQGMIFDTEGDPITDTLNLTIAIYDDSISIYPSNILWDESHPGVGVIEGLFQVTLGAGNPAEPISDSIFSGPDRWLGVTIEGSAEQSPRIRITSNAYSQRVGTVDGAAGGAVTGDLTVNGKASIGINVTNTGLNAFAVGENINATADYSSVSGGINNNATAAEAAVGGGRSNTASGIGSVVAGGYAGTASNENTFIGGGWHNVASGIVATVGGGQEDTASGVYSFIGGGYMNAASEWGSTVGGGQANKSRSYFSTVPGGFGNQALGFYSMAAGLNSIAGHDGSFVWSDIYGGGASTSPNQFIIRASGGVGIGTNNPTAALHVEGEAKSVVGGVEYFMVPRGGIIMWSGTLASIPAGWALCDGTNGTPDLRDRFIWGCSAGENPGAMGGATSHNHQVDIGPFGSGIPSNSWLAASGGLSYLPTYDHTHEINPPATASSVAGHIPPYYKLAFIMKL
jgi:hypothetical protein